MAPRTVTDRIIFFLLALTLAWGAFAFGAVYEWSYRPLLLVAALAGALASWRAPRRPAPTVLIAGVVATAAAIALQLIPLDHATLARFFPGTHRVLSELNLPYFIAASAGARFAHPLSVSPDSTIIGLAFLGSAAIFTLGIAQWLTRDRLRHFAAVITAIGALLALEGIIQQAVSPQLVYGFWQAEQVGHPFGPFINRNHFAGWILMGLPIALGLAAGLTTRTERPARSSWRTWLLRLEQPETAGGTMALFAAFTMMVALLFTLSRSAIGSAAVSVALAMLIAMRTARDRVRPPLISVVVLATAALVWVGVDALSTRFAQLDAVSFDGRVRIWSDTWRMAQDVPFTGVGIRAYTVASLLYQTALPEFHVGAAHNDWLQLIAEGGLLVSLPACGLLAALIHQAAARIREHRRDRDYGTTYWIRVGVVTGLVAIGLQSLLEFSLQMPGNTMMFAALWGIAIAPAPRPRPASSRPREREGQMQEDATPPHPVLIDGTLTVGKASVLPFDRGGFDWTADARPESLNRAAQDDLRETPREWHARRSREDRHRKTRQREIAGVIAIALALALLLAILAL